MRKNKLYMHFTFNMRIVTTKMRIANFKMRKNTLICNGIFLFLKFAILTLVVTILILKVKWCRYEKQLTNPPVQYNSKVKPY